MKDLTNANDRRQVVNDIIMISQRILHYTILEKLGEARLRPADSGGQGDPTALQEMELRRTGLVCRNLIIRMDNQ